MAAIFNNLDAILNTFMLLLWNIHKWIPRPEKPQNGVLHSNNDEIIMEILENSC